MSAPSGKPKGDDELQMAQPKAPPMKIPEKFPDMPWKKKPPINAPEGDKPKTDGEKH